MAASFSIRPASKSSTGPARGAVLRASRATIEPPGTFWLLQRIVAGDTAVPRGLDLHLEGASFSEDAVDRYAHEGWFGATSLVPFENARLRARQRVLLARLRAHGHDDATRARMSCATATIPTHARCAPTSRRPPRRSRRSRRTWIFPSFDPTAWFGDARAAKAERVEQFALTWLDGGYLAKRNRFCAQLTGTDAAGYAARHLAAVKNFLQARGIVPGEDVANLYRKLVAEGGSAEISSLPEAAFVPTDFAEYEPEDLLRQLNVTLRRNTRRRS